MLDPDQTIDLTPEEQKAIRENSLERVINTTLRILETIPEDPEGLIATNREDWLVLKPVSVKAFEFMKEIVRDHRNEEKKLSH
jgi:hypothetical protein